MGECLVICRFNNTKYRDLLALHAQVLDPVTTVSVAQAYAICERLRAHIQSEDICLPDGTEINVTISSGIARLFADDTGLALVERADQALYEAKNGGRDQVRLAA